MRGDDDVVEVGACQHVIKEGPWIRQIVLLDESSICDKAVTPAHLDGRLAHALYEEKGCRAELQQPNISVGAECSRVYSARATHKNLDSQYQ